MVRGDAGRKRASKYQTGRGSSLRSLLFPAGRGFSLRLVRFFQVLRGSAAKFIQSAKLCSTACRPPEGSTPSDKRWEPELNGWLRT